MTVLVGYLPTREGEAAFEAGLREATLRRSRLVLLNSPRTGAPVDADLATDDQLHRLGERAQQAGVEFELRQTPHDDDLVDSVLDAAESSDADLIVIGLRRRSAVGKLFLGSNAQRILMRADRPVLAVKPGDRRRGEL